MTSAAEIRALLRECLPEIREKYGVTSIGIFGSYSTGRQTGSSDLDLVVEFDRPIGMMAFVHLRDRISGDLGMPVDLVTPDGLHPLIRDQVLREVVYV